ncbi:MAG: hypothetical protein JEZ09_17800 [Salinivirgaceae bacterium]|nr:hypothetical protein [Salinivirgaceae bacterium]
MSIGEFRTLYRYTQRYKLDGRIKQFTVKRKKWLCIERQKIRDEARKSRSAVKFIKPIHITEVVIKNKMHESEEDILQKAARIEKRRFNEDDYIGKKYGMLTIESFTTPRKYKASSTGNIVKARYVLCMCDCGRVKNVSTCNLTEKGSPYSCGCVRKKKYNSIEERKVFTLATAILKRSHANICSEWQNREAFGSAIINEIGTRPKSKFFSRIDMSKPFESGNIMWSVNRDITRSDHNLLTAVKLAEASGYSCERVRQLSCSGLLDNFIVNERKEKAKTIRVFSEQAVTFLKSRRSNNKTSKTASKRGFNSVSLHKKMLYL